jgi:hypothetical protein
VRYTKVLISFFISFRTLTSGHYAEVIVETDGCHGQPNEVNYLEHVQFIFSLNYSRRGAIRVELTSPSGQFSLKSSPWQNTI